MDATLGARRRKRQAAMRHVQRVALDLFDQHGFDAVTIEQVAAASAVSPSSVYRYFRTKEGLILTAADDQPLITLEVEAGKKSLTDALRETVAAYLQGRGDDAFDRRRMRYLMEVGSVQGAVARRLLSGTQLIAQDLARLSGQPVDSAQVQVIWGALYGGLLGALRSWHADDYRRSISDVVDEALLLLAPLLDETESSAG